MRAAWPYAISFSAALLLCACAGPAPLPPAPAQSVDAARLFTGRWYEIARTPMHITNGCVAGTTDYVQGANGQLMELDACHTDTPEGKEKSIQGPLIILNPGVNNETLVHYHIFYGLITISRRYWIFGHGADYDWFIFGDPHFKYISVFSRSPRPGAAGTARLTAHAQALGYDVSKLEYPTEFPPGGG